MTEDTATSGQTAKPPRVRGRPFAPGPDPRRSLAGRPPLAVEVAHAEALRRGCPSAELERAIARWPNWQSRETSRPRASSSGPLVSGGGHGARGRAGREHGSAPRRAGQGRSRRPPDGRSLRDDRDDLDPGHREGRARPWVSARGERRGRRARGRGDLAARVPGRSSALLGRGVAGRGAGARPRWHAHRTPELPCPRTPDLPQALRGRGRGEGDELPVAVTKRTGGRWIRQCALDWLILVRLSFEACGARILAGDSCSTQAPALETPALEDSPGPVVP